jgi:hypothetical protein
MRPYGELSKDQEPLLPRQFCSDCIIATRGYDFREGQVAELSTRRFGKLATPSILSGRFNFLTTRG